MTDRKVLEAKVDELSKELAELKERERWVSVSERLPEADTEEEIRSVRVWVWVEKWRNRDDHDAMRLGYYLRGPLNEWRIDGSPSNWNGDVTAWRYLPTPPAQEAENGKR